MKHIIIGTAGHVDHGKTALIRALTGTDTDRLAEEKRRGMTIDLGFACLPLPNGSIAGIVDVPGHERFIRNMLAGAGGLDMAILVVAADDGVMPQTLEHLHILNLLGTQTGIIAITKTDLVQTEQRLSVEKEIRRIIAGTFLADAPIVPVSSHAGTGIAALKTCIGKTAETIVNKNQALPFRMHIDRVFSVTGFGTVVTGTLLEGALQQGDEIMLFPALQTVRVRGLQVHGQNITAACAGQRVAVNLSGLSQSAIKRGDTLAAPASMATTCRADVRLSFLPGGKQRIKSGTQLHIYHGSTHLPCRVILLDRTQLNPGETGYSQLCFTREVSLKKGDRFVLRYPSPPETIGGGTVLNPAAGKHKRQDTGTVEALNIYETGSIADCVVQAVTARPLVPLSAIKIQLNLDEPVFLNTLETLSRDKRILLLNKEAAVTPAFKQKLGEKLHAVLSAYHGAHPLLEGMPKNELQSRLLPGNNPEIAKTLLDLFLSDGCFCIRGQKAALPGFRVTYSKREQTIQAEIEALFLNGGFAPPSLKLLYEQFATKDKEAAARVAEAMTDRGILVQAAADIYFHAAVLEDAENLFHELIGQNKTGVTLGLFRDKAGTTRKYAVAILEHFDKNGLTRRACSVRLLRNKQT